MKNELEVIWTFMLDYTKGWGVRKHAHDYFQMYYCIAGEGLFCLDGNEITLAQDVCLILRPHQVHELYPLRAGQLRLIDTKFYIHDPVLCQTVFDMPPLVVIHDKNFRELQQSMRNEWASGAVYAKEMATLLFSQSLYLFLRENTHSVAPLPFYHALEDRMEGLNGIEKSVADYLELHFLEEITLDQLADTLRYSKNYLCKAFKAAAHCTISEFTNFLRIRKAYQMVCCTNQRLSDIAVTCGFSSIHYFSRTFHKIVGMSPTQARDQDRNSLYTDIRLHGTFRYRYFSEEV